MFDVRWQRTRIVYNLSNILILAILFVVQLESPVESASIIKNHICEGTYNSGTKAAGVGYCDFATFEHGKPTQPFTEIDKVCEAEKLCRVVADVMPIGKYGGQEMHYSIVHVSHVEKVNTKSAPPSGDTCSVDLYTRKASLDHC
jgi:hypothetical protein